MSIPAWLAGTPPSQRSLRRAQAVLLLSLAGYSAATAVLPALRLGVFAPELRIAIEVGGMCFMLFAALTLALPLDDDVGPARNAFVVALSAMALTNAAFSVVPALLVRGVVTENIGLAFSPWIASRCLAGVLFILAALSRPWMSLRALFVVVFGALAGVDAALLFLGDRLVLPFVFTVDPAWPRVEVRPFGAHAVSQAVPGVLFAVGSWLAGRLFVRSGAPVYRWISLALLIQVFAQVHEALFPAILGPVITSADALRSTAHLFLLTGALLQVLQLYRARSAAFNVQGKDLQRQEVLLEEMHRLAEREEDFRAVVTHELATPIATVEAYARVLNGCTDGEAPAILRKAVAGIGRETRRLKELVARMEELRSLELAGFVCDLRPMRIRPLVQEAVQFADALPGAHPVTVRCEDVRVLGDPVRLGQALRNVLANAARYSPVHSPIMLDGTVAGAERLLLEVVDRGPGVPAHEQHRVLRKYGRGADSEGAGLGLYIASRIVEAHGGRLSIADPDDAQGGTKVVIELRLSS
jgi:signal transduction histidine kinase